VFLLVLKKILKKIAGPLILLALLFLILAAAAAYIPGFKIPLLPKLSLGSRSRVSDSQIVLATVRPLFSLSTVEYTYKSVFPYDFFPEDIDFTQLRTYDFAGIEAPEALREAMDLYLLCRELGISVAGGSYDFAVITTRIKAGYDLVGTNWAADSSAADPSTTLNPPTRLPVSLIHQESGKKIATVRLPEPQITEFIIQDETSEEYGYPDIDLTAAEWKRITAYVAEKIRHRVIEEGILDAAEEQTRELIRRLLSQAGWDEVRFSD
jgi:hypothetical protein